MSARGLVLLLVATTAVAEPDPAVRAFHWSRKSPTGIATLVQTATAARVCRVACARGAVQVWVRPVCLGLETDFVFVSDDCLHAASLFEYPRRAEVLGQSEVGLLLVDKLDPTALGLGRFMIEPSRVTLNGPRFRWLAGALDEPGVAPRYRSDGSGIEFETLERKPISVTFSQLASAQKPDASRPADELYEWTDAQGAMNVTPWSGVPERYRKQARRLTGEVSVVSASPPSTARAPAPAQRKDPRDDEALWRGRFLKARNRITEVEKEIAAAQAKLTTLKRGRRGMVVPLTAADADRARAVIDNAEAERKKAEDALHDLEREAANAAVPLEWRR